MTLTSFSLALMSLGGASVAEAAQTPSVFYLDLGASASVGFQPTPTHPLGELTNHGYANDLVALEAAKGLSLQLVQAGCPGETTSTMISGRDHCYHSPATQLSTATSFLRSHYDEIGIVSIDLGFNNVVRCVKKTVGVSSCLTHGFNAVRQELPRILSTLRAAAGPHTHFVGVNHYDPFLTSALQGPSGEVRAHTSFEAMSTLNQTLSGIYRSFSIPVADVAGAFKMNDHTLTTLSGVGSVATNIAEVCMLTWMCQNAPYGPNLHPNDSGYHVIALAIAAALLHDLAATLPHKTQLV
jgi:lysophospholipase L1-like esterase